MQLIDEFRDSYGYPCRLYAVMLIDRETVFCTTHHEYGYTVIDGDYSGHEDKLRLAHSFTSEQDAITQLIDKMNDAIENNKI